MCSREMEVGEYEHYDAPKCYQNVRIVIRIIISSVIASKIDKNKGINLMFDGNTYYVVVLLIIIVYLT